MSHPYDPDELDAKIAAHFQPAPPCPPVAEAEEAVRKFLAEHYPPCSEPQAVQNGMEDFLAGDANGYARAKAENDALAAIVERKDRAISQQAQLIETQRGKIAELEEALEKIAEEAGKLYDKDRDELMMAPAGNPNDCWSAPSRHLQTFAWLQNFAQKALGKEKP